MASYAWLDAPPRRRQPIPSRDLATGVGMGLGSCGVALLLAMSMELPEPAPEEPLTISIGVTEAETPSGASGSPGGGGGASGSPAPAIADEGPSIEAPTFIDPTAASPRPTTTTTVAPHPRTHRRPSGPAPALPGLGDLDGPVEEPGNGGGPRGTGGLDGNGSAVGEDSGGGNDNGDGGLAAYRSQLAAWLSSHFHVTGSGLSPSALRALRVRATLELSEDRVVTDVHLEPTGTAAIDEAARQALESVREQPAPEPPPGYGVVQRRIRVTFRCRPDTCS